MFDDKIFAPENYTVAYFSSLGPTFDGRIKPDVIAPGDVIMSAFAGDVNTLKSAINNNVGGQDSETCAVHQLEGTSMATPLVAGVALLMRQYFMDPAFWAANCNPLYRNCREGSFTPSGYLLKSLIVHSGQGVPWYSNPVHDSSTTLSSFPLSGPPDMFQGYGEVVLRNVLPLPNGRGLNTELDLVVFDRLEIGSFSTVELAINLAPKDRSHHAPPRDEGQSHSSPPLAPLKITIAWYDPPSMMGSGSSMLLHDLDLVVVGPNGNVHVGTDLTHP